jgi:Fe-S-cluster containining protein
VLSNSQYDGCKRCYSATAWQFGGVAKLFVLPWHSGGGDDEQRNQFYYTMDITCSELTADKRCRVHDSPEKPLICNRFPETKEDIEDIKSCGFRFTPILPGHPLKD